MARAAKSAPGSGEAQGAGGGQTTPKINWDDSQMDSTYANVCNVSSTREEVVFVFGVNQAWNREQNEVTVELSNRVILSPYAAKRLSILLGNVLKEYENRFGELKLDVAAGSSTPAPPAAEGSTS